MPLENLEKIRKVAKENPEVMKELGTKSLWLFFHLYFSQYITTKSAPFHREWCKIIQKSNTNFLEIIGFRGSAKTSYLMLAYPIWTTVTEKSHYTVILSDTGNQVKDHFYNITTELENNDKLIRDFGPFKGQEQWSSKEIILPKYDSKITGRSTGQKVRGIRYKQWRPQLVIGDDLENLELVRTKSRRDRSYKWFKGDIMNIGEEGSGNNTRFVLIGNLLHRDCLMARIKEDIENGKMNGFVREYSLIDDEGNITWKGKYSDMKAVRDKKGDVGEVAWQREFLLNTVPEEGQVVHEDWIEYYDSVPNESPQMQGTGIDLAVGQKQSNDCTAMVSAQLYEEDGKPVVYIMRNPVNDRITSRDRILEAKRISNDLGGDQLTPLWVEDVAYQRDAIQRMRDEENLPAEGVKVTKDKRARLKTITSYIQSGRVKFPKKGCEDLIGQLVGFGIEPHDDLVDAMVMAVHRLMKAHSKSTEITQL